MSCAKDVGNDEATLDPIESLCALNGRIDANLTRTAELRREILQSHFGWSLVIREARCIVV
jgi:hypothetical protein